MAFLEGSELRIVGKPEYHGNPQNAGGSLVTWRYGYDLPQRICAVPADETPRIQEMHIAVGHAICELVEAALA